MREHVRLLDAGAASAGASRPKKKLRLRRMVNERARGKPLQYILGDQPFGGLDILCRKGVLIPRYVCLVNPDSCQHSLRCTSLS